MQVVLTYRIWMNNETFLLVMEDEVPAILQSGPDLREQLFTSVQHKCTYSRTSWYTPVFFNPV